MIAILRQYGAMKLTVLHEYIKHGLEKKTNYTREDHG